MGHRREERSPEACGEPLQLRRSAREGVWWERGDGLAVRLAAPERTQAIERGRLSLVGMLLAWIASPRKTR